MTPRNQLRDKAEAAKLTGMGLAAGAKLDRITAGKIAMLRALLTSPDGVATIDDATADLTEGFRDGGRWRGSVCRSLAMVRIIESIGAVKSERPSRHRGFVTRWRLADRHKAALLLTSLVASLDPRLSTADDLKKSETSTDATAEASVQKNFPDFEKGFSHGHTL